MFKILVLARIPGEIVKLNEILLHGQINLAVPLVHYVSVNSSWVHPTGQPPGISSKNCPGGSEFDFWKLPGGREFDKGGDFVETQSETFCRCIGFISDKCRVSQKFLKNGEHCIVDFQFKLRLCLSQFQLGTPPRGRV